MAMAQDRSMAGRTSVVGVFDNSGFARDAVQDLVRAGFSDAQIGIVAPDATTTDDTSAVAANVTAGATAGIATGASVGALWAIGIAAGLLPAIGPVIAGGVLASVLASAAGGAAIAGLVGALIGLGIPEDEARFYEAEFHAGRTLVTVRADARLDEAQTILRAHGAYDVRTKGTYQSTDEYRRKLGEASTVDHYPVRPPQPR